ncbi:MAG: TolC family protein [Saprospiraceae bacterium]|nr:TolC family protein [Saprospiraceae bacterium]
MRLKAIFYTFVLTIVSMPLLAQQGPWDLRKCIEYARENNLNLERAEYFLEDAALVNQRNRLSRLPSLNGQTSVGAQFGYTIDPTTNTFRSQSIGYNSFSLNAGMTLYDGGRINHTVKQGEASLEAARYDVDAAFNDLSLQIASAYLQILLGDEQMSAAKKRLNLAQLQLEQTDKLIKAGSLPENDRLDILAQVALNEQTLIQAENARASALLSLRQLLQMDLGQPLEIVRPNVVVPEKAAVETFNATEVYLAALNTQPQIKADEYRMEAAEEGVGIARSLGIPSLNIFGNMSTNWSSLGSRLTGEESVVFVPVDVKFPDGTETSLELGQPFPVREDSPYGTQLRDNFGQNLGVSLNIPIYNASNASISKQRAEIAVLNARVTADLNKQLLMSDVQRAVNDVTAAERTYAAAQRSFEAASASLANAQKRFDLGAINTFELTTAQNNNDQSEIELIRSKYQYLFNLKILDFYLGRELTID